MRQPTGMPCLLLASHDLYTNFYFVSLTSITTSSSVAMGRHALTALQWSCVAVHRKTPVPSTLLTCQAVFLAAVCSTKLWSKAVRTLTSLWTSKEGGGSTVIEESVLALLSASPSPAHLLLLCVLTHCCRQHKLCLQLLQEKQVFL